MFGQCDYATEDWYCVKREGHDGPHESVSLGARCTCDRDTRMDGMASPGCPVHAPATSRERR
jgi:hypothetical protein